MSEASATDFPVTTALGLPGMTIERDLGVAFGLVVRSMGLAKSVGAGFSAMRRGSLCEHHRRHHVVYRRVGPVQQGQRVGVLAA